MAGRSCWQKTAALRRGHLARWLAAVHSPATVEQVESWLEEQPAYADLAARWDAMSEPERASAAAALDEWFRRAAYASRPYCLRCGTCCRNSGPSLFAGDELLLKEGVLCPADLCTLRTGEEVFSHWEGRRIVLTRESIRIVAGLGGACRFYDPPQRRCRIHDKRPAQCRAQQCWDTEHVDRLMASPGLTRLDLLANDHPARTIIAQHDRACSPAELRQYVADGREHERHCRDMARKIAALAERDRQFRQQLCASRAELSEGLMLWLGRPVEELLADTGLALSASGPDGPGLVPRAGPR